MNSRQVLNISVLNAWKQVDPDRWQSLASEIIDLYMQFSPIHLRSLKEAYRNGDYRMVRELAHTMKSSCGNIGAEIAFDLLDQIEKIADDQLPHLEKLIQDLDSNLNLVSQELLSFQKKLYAT